MHNTHVYVCLMYFFFGKTEGRPNFKVTLSITFSKVHLAEGFHNTNI